MKTLLPLFFILFLTLTYGQKKEIKKAIKLFETGDVQGASATLESSAALFEIADEKVLSQKTFLEGRIEQANKNFQAAFDKYMDYKSAVGSDAILETQLQSLSADAVNSAIEDNELKN